MKATTTEMLNPTYDLVVRLSGEELVAIRTALGGLAPQSIRALVFASARASSPELTSQANSLDKFFGHIFDSLTRVAPFAENAK